MGKLSRFETAVVVSVATTGLGVAATAALAEHRKITAAASATPLEEIEIKVPSMPASKDEFVDGWCQGYVDSKGHLSKLFRFAGQMVVAPVAVIVIDALYGFYLDRVEANAKGPKAVSM